MRELSIPSKDQMLKAGILDQLLLKRIQESDEKSAIQKILELDLYVIARLATASAAFKKNCENEVLGKHWEFMWTCFCKLFTNDKEPFFPTNTNRFELIMGIFFFVQSTLVNKNIGYDFSPSELEFLKEGIQYKSIHAVQRYNEYLSMKIKHAESHLESDRLHRAAIENCQIIAPYHGSYGYLMLAEAYYRYYLLLTGSSNSKNATAIYKAAIQSCDYAINLFSASRASGLETSNSMGFTDPSAARNFIVCSRPKSTAPLTSDIKTVFLQSRNR